jgi:hypothetical protein
MVMRRQGRLLVMMGGELDSKGLVGWTCRVRHPVDQIRSDRGLAPCKWQQASKHQRWNGV